MQTYSDSRVVLRETALKNTPTKRGLRTKGDGASAPEVEIFKLDGMAAAPSSKTRAGMERSIKTNKMITNIEKK